MRKILTVVQDFLRKHPTPADISLLGPMLQLNYSYSSPFTNSKHSKTVYLPRQTIKQQTIIEPTYRRLIYSDKGRIQESNSFDSVLINQQHKQVMQDACFGKAVHNKDGQRWAYVAEVKEEAGKSVFNGGKGKTPFRYDMGQAYEGIKQIGLFIWDKASKKVHRIKLNQDMIPAHVSFSNAQGTELIFHAYKRRHFSHGIIHCMNRPVKIYTAKLTFQKDTQSPSATKINSEVTPMIEDGKETNMFPRISPCFNYLVYMSGTGITHLYYLDYVVAKKEGGKWVETHRLKEKVVGYPQTFHNYVIKENNKVFGFVKTYNHSTTQIEKMDLETGQLTNLTEKYQHKDLTVHDIAADGLIIGTVNTYNYNSFFFSKGNDLQIVKPINEERFDVQEYYDPIPAVLVTAKAQNLEEEYRNRVEKRPMVVTFHGGPHDTYRPVLTCLRYSLLKLGYALLFPNIPGSMSHGQEYLHGAVGGIGQKDAQPFIHLLKKVLNQNPNFDKNQVHVCGGSYGGYMSALMGSRHSEHFKSAVTMNGVYNNLAMMWFTDIPEWVPAQTLGRGDLYTYSEADYLEMIRQSSANLPMKIPTLQFLGAKDLRVPHRQGLFFDAITKLHGTPITTYVYQESNHQLADSVQTQMDITVKTLCFLQGIESTSQ